MIRRLSLMLGFGLAMSAATVLAQTAVSSFMPTPLLDEPPAPAGSGDAARTGAGADSVWTVYKARFLTADGRIVDNGNGGVSHSEGQGYGLLLAAFAGDREAFDRIWAWTQRELMVRGDRLAAWRWQERATPRVSDRNNATDGDLLIAWALVEGADRFGDEGLRSSARGIANDIGAKLVRPSQAGPVLLPGEQGFHNTADGLTLNLSYWVFPALEKIAPLAPEVDWDGVIATGLRLIDTSQFGPARLPANWVSLADGRPVPAKSRPALFGYDAIRIPLYLAWAGGDRRAELGRFARLWSADGDIGPFEIDLTTGAATDAMPGAGFKLVAALAACTTENARIPAFLTATLDDTYYPATLRALAGVLLQTRYRQCL